MSPELIMVIRHGEKPPLAGGPPYGVDADGRRDTGSLTPRGWQRAGGLVRFFEDPPAGIQTPDRIYAAKPKVAGGSMRPYQTVLPLAERFTRGRIRASIHRSQINVLTSAALADSGVVLICWDHEHIPEIASAILKSDDVPRWSGKRFDMVWCFTRKSSTYRLKIVMQSLLGGDLAP